MRQLPSPGQIRRDPQTCASVGASAALFNRLKEAVPVQRVRAPSPCTVQPYDDLEFQEAAQWSAGLTPRNGQYARVEPTTGGPCESGRPLDLLG
jgi:hypothetical protein